MHTIPNELISEWDEIESIEYIGLVDTIDINVTGEHLFYANDILTHNSAVEEIEFDHSHISGGLSKIMTADNVIGIFTSRAMKERGRYQIQFMKTRSSSGVGQKVDLEFNIDTLRISDLGDDEETTSSSLSQQRSSPTTASVMEGLKRTSVVSTASIETIDPETGEIIKTSKPIGKKPGGAATSTSSSSAPKIRSMLSNLNPEKD